MADGSTGGRAATRILRAGAGLAGHALGALFGAVGQVRRDRALHPRGATYAALATMHGGSASGVPWLDTAGTTRVVVRVSRATGLPSPWPDVHGIAIHVPAEVLSRRDGADLLFASTGDSGLGRFRLAARREAAGGPLTTLLPMRTGAGPMLFRLRPVEGPATSAAGLVGARYQLSYAVGTRPWTVVGEIQVGAPEGEQVDRRRHDPVLHTLPGTEQYPVVAALREPAYRAARRVPAS
ncbi:hypothetical protein [Pedococcus sp.]|uniref:hypothetical protein n=1 Tax=Pedococcus sp. TaxID=2860345 RepID=UPI002E14947E|nr:hypothetical protein [Pedococcus sp.]